MQKRQPLGSRRGSVLAGVIALTLIVSLAASGFIMVSSATQTDDVGSLSRTKLYYAAQSGLQMGVYFLKKNYLSATLNEKTLITANAISHGWKTVDDGFKDSVVVQRFLKTTPPYDTAIKVVCWATSATAASDTVRLMWAVDTALPATSGNLSKPKMSSWSDTLFPKR